MRIATLSFVWLVAVVVLPSTQSVAAWPEGISPSHAYARVALADQVLDRILAKRGIESGNAARSFETKLGPMHVYQVHQAVIRRLYEFELKNGVRPPPQVSSTPIKYAPSDVMMLSSIVLEHTQKIAAKDGIEPIWTEQTFTQKTPTEVFEIIFNVFYKTNLLLGVRKISPGEVYREVQRAVADVQNILRQLARRVPPEEDHKKRLLISSVYGLHPDGSMMLPRQDGLKPKDAMQKLLDVRQVMNRIRVKFGMATVPLAQIPAEVKVTPIDVILQSQIVISEINILKKPLEIRTVTPRGIQPETKLTPSDVQYSASHLEYMLTRLINTL